MKKYSYLLLIFIVAVGNSWCGRASHHPIPGADQIELYKDIYGYGKNSKYSQENKEELIRLSSTENILTEYKKNIRDNNISDEKLRKIIEYVMNNGDLYERYYIKDIESLIETQEEPQIETQEEPQIETPIE